MQLGEELGDRGIVDVEVPEAEQNERVGREPFNREQHVAHLVHRLQKDVERERRPDEPVQELHENHELHGEDEDRLGELQLLLVPRRVWALTPFNPRGGFPISMSILLTATGSILNSSGRRVS